MSLRFLIVQENGRHEANRRFRECFGIQKALISIGCACDVWGWRHPSYARTPHYENYDVIVNLENYDDRGWVPDFSGLRAYRVLWAIDAHYKGLPSYKDIFTRGSYNLMLQATRDYVDKDAVWFPNCYDDTLIQPRTVPSRADVGFCGNILNRGLYIDFLKKRFNFRTDVFVIGDAMVDAICSYRAHFNKNIANDINYRSFETIGCGVPLVTNYNPQYVDLGFEDGVNSLLYKDTAELEYKIKALLCDETRRVSIAQAGFALARRHTYHQRAKELLKILEPRV